LLPVGVLIVLGAVWCWLWYYAASVADRTLSGWVEREAAAGRIYTCRSQGIGGFPLSIQAHCVEASAAINSNEPPVAVSAKDITFVAQVFEPTELVGRVASPVMVSLPGQSTSFVANWTRGELRVRGVPPQPESVTVTVDHPRLDQVVAANQTAVFTADYAEVRSRIVAGSANHDPVIDTFISFTAATAPTLHPMLATPAKGEIDVVFKGFKDLSPKPWAERFREMQASGGSIEITHFRLDRSDSIIVGTGTLKVNEHGKLDGLIRVAISGVEKIVPQLGIDRAIGRGIDRLAGDQQAQGGLGALDKLLPGLGGALRDTANATVIDSLNKMGQPTDIDKKPAIVLPLNVSDGFVSLGMLPLGQVPAVF